MAGLNWLSRPSGPTPKCQRVARHLKSRTEHQQNLKASTPASSSLVLTRLLWREKTRSNKYGHYIPERTKNRAVTGASRGADSAKHRTQTAKLPSDTFLWGAIGSIATSLILQLTGQEKKANFVGQWAPPLLILGLYNKMVNFTDQAGRAELSYGLLRPQSGEPLGGRDHWRPSLENSNLRGEAQDHCSLRIPRQ